ncbi:MAG: acetylxylan esterase [Bryobacterales bacterium]|nr:acetylxylan esterase [Bryobacterales bacterium]
MTFSVLFIAAVTVVGDLSGMLDTWLSRIAERHFAERRQTLAAIQTPEQVRARQEYVRRTILESLGGFPEKTPLNPKITGTLEREDYRIEKLVFESLPGFRVTANVYVPKGTGPFPAILGVAGHSNEGKAIDTYQRAWIGFVKRGWLVIAFDPPGQGERSEYWDAAAGKSKVGIGTREHTMAGLQALLTGTNVARYEIWDGIRAFDYLLTRPEVDPKRIAVAGNSGGGTQSAYLSVMEPRLAAAAPSCYITSWTKLWYKPGPQDAEQDFHNFIGAGLDFGDFLLAFAPKPIKMMTAIRDFFPIEGARATYQETARLFEILGARDKIDFFEYDDVHGWSKPRREATYRWFEKHLNNREDDGLEPEFSVEKPDVLNVTPTGQLATSFGSETVFSLNKKLAEQMYPQRAAAKSGADIVSLVKRRLVVDLPSTPLTLRAFGETGRDGYRIEKYTLETEAGITVPALLYLPAKRGTAKMAATLCFDAQGKQVCDSTLAKVALDGKIGLAIDPRGWGESAAPTGQRGGYGPAYQSFMRALLLGRTMLGIQVVDVLRAVEFLAKRPEVDAAQIQLVASGNAATLGLYAAALDKRIARISAIGHLQSYLWLAEQPVHDGYLDVIVPGVLKDFDIPDLTKYLGARYAH